ncbi:MAG: hypothetical protein LPK45_08185, partial [Bacteroidota bacterium]|nr:hypothetical protein [Bacteroidota bacterium]MDX5431046.1 hypothetical protein [Bacteroidota bacterium]MDX5469800.1 hypothetical protein [Bacteroidota bacterium]
MNLKYCLFLCAFFGVLRLPAQETLLQTSPRSYFPWNIGSPWQLPNETRHSLAAKLISLPAFESAYSFEAGAVWPLKKSAIRLAGVMQWERLGAYRQLGGRMNL